MSDQEADRAAIIELIHRNRIAIEVGAMIYGLSPARQRVGALVAEALNLAQIAERMSITANTARTHLDRIFQKTGVRTQTALVRVLLSAVSPA